MRTCPTCKIEKPLTEYHKATTKTLGVQSNCKMCQAAKHKKYYEDPKNDRKAKVVAQKKLGTERRRAFILQYKSNPCMDCGGKFEPCAMDFDHVRGKKYKALSCLVLAQASEEMILEELKKCELVCSNCHRVRTRDRSLLKKNQQH